MSFTYHDRSGEAKRAIEQAIARSLEMIGGKAEGYAKGLAPVDTGNLRNSINHRVEENSAIISTNTEYAIYQELGTRKMSAANGGRGYMKPAAEEHISEYRNILESELKSILN